MLKEKYMEVVTMLQTDIDHIDFHLEREDEPREIATLKKLRMELVARRNGFLEAIQSLD